jgi:hypothetical protein
MTAYQRYRVKGGCYFLTVALAEWRGNLLTENLEGLRAAFREVKQVHPFEMNDGFRCTLPISYELLEPKGMKYYSYK